MPNRRSANSTPKWFTFETVTEFMPGMHTLARLWWVNPTISTQADVPCLRFRRQPDTLQHPGCNREPQH